MYAVKGFEFLTRLSLAVKTFLVEVNPSGSVLLVLCELSVYNGYEEKVEVSCEYLPIVLQPVSNSHYALPNVGLPEETSWYIVPRLQVYAGVRACLPSVPSQSLGGHHFHPISCTMLLQ